MPFDTVALLVHNNGLAAVRALRIVRLFRLVKLLRILRAGRIFKRMETAVEIDYASMQARGGTGSLVAPCADSTRSPPPVVERGPLRNSNLRRRAAGHVWADGHDVWPLDGVPVGPHRRHPVPRQHHARRPPPIVRFCQRPVTPRPAAAPSPVVPLRGPAFWGGRGFSLPSGHPAGGSPGQTSGGTWRNTLPIRALLTHTSCLSTGRVQPGIHSSSPPAAALPDSALCAGFHDDVNYRVWRRCRF